MGTLTCGFLLTGLAVSSPPDRRFHRTGIFLKPYDKIVEIHVVGDALDSGHIEHIGESVVIFGMYIYALNARNSKSFFILF